MHFTLDNGTWYAGLDTGELTLDLGDSIVELIGFGKRMKKRKRVS